MDPITVLIDVIDLSIEPWIMALAATQMLPMRRRGLFLAIELMGTPLWAFAFGTVLSWFWVGLLVCGVLEFVLPLLFWTGSLFRKVSALFVIQLCSIVAGAVVWTCWEAIFGMPIPEDSAAEFALYRSAMGKWLIYQVLDIGLSAILLIPAVVLFRRWAWRTADTRGSVLPGPFVGNRRLCGYRVDSADVSDGRYRGHRRLVALGSCRPRPAPQ